MDHFNSHTGSKSYKCSHCSKAFSYSSDYYVHLKKHRGITKKRPAKKGSSTCKTKKMVEEFKLNSNNSKKESEELTPIEGDDSQDESYEP